jgi:hypothetical protein
MPRANAWLYPPEPEAIAAHFERFGAAGGLLIQPFISGVELERDNLHTPTAGELSYCRQLLESLPRLAYARVDLLPFHGRPALMELEIIDPSLFFEAQPSAADWLAAEAQAALEQSALADRS